MLVAKYTPYRVAAHRFTRAEADAYNDRQHIAARPMPSVVEGQVQHIYDTQGRCVLRPVEVRIGYEGAAIRVACNRAARWSRSGRSFEDAPHHIKLAAQILGQVIGA